MSVFDDDFAWAKEQYGHLTESDVPIIATLEQELLAAINAMDDTLEDEEMETQFRSVISRLQLEAYMAGYSNGIRVAGDDTSVRITARIDADEATEIVKALVTSGEIPLSIRVVSE